MAEDRREIEENAAAMAACMTEKGWPMKVMPDGSQQMVAELLSEQREIAFEAYGECNIQVNGEYVPRTEAEWRDKYHKALDTRDCLVNEGYSIPEPPSEDAWVDAGLHDQPLWTPFQFAIDEKMNGSEPWTLEEYYELYDKCPQAGPTAGVSF